MFVQIVNVKHDKDSERDHFGDNLELRSRIRFVSHPIRWNLETIFEKRDPPACENHDPERFGSELQMPIPREGHEAIGNNE